MECAQRAEESGAGTEEVAQHAPWLNIIEQWFGVLTRRLLRRGDFTSRDDLEAKITSFTIRHNKNARPYKWNYDATLSTPATSNGTPSPDPCPPPCRKLHEPHAR